MLRRIYLAIYLFLAFALLGHAQMGMQKPRPVSLHFIVTIDGNAEKARRVTIELMDDLGSGSGRTITNENGEATFQTMSGVYRIRVSGPGIRTYEGEVEIAPIESSHLERVLVRRDPAADASVPGEPIAAVRLNIPDNAHKTFDKASQALHKEKWDESCNQVDEAEIFCNQFKIHH